MCGLQKAILDFVNLVQDPVEYIALVEFNDRVEVVIELDSFGATETRWEPAANQLRAGGETSLYDAVADSIGILEGIGNTERSNIIIALTDGEDTDSRHSLNGVIRMIEDASVEITFIGLAYKGDGDNYNLNVLKRLAVAGNAAEWAMEATPGNVSEIFRSLTKWFQDDDAVQTNKGSRRVSLGCQSELSTPSGYTRVEITNRGSVWGTPEMFTDDSRLGNVAYMLLGRVKGCDFANTERDRRSKVYVKIEDLGRLSKFDSGKVCSVSSRTWSGSWTGLQITHLRIFDETSPTGVREYAYNSATGQYVEIPASG